MRTGKQNLLWQKITKYVQRIWQLWRCEYVINFQEIAKWLIEKDNVKIGTVVLEEHASSYVDGGKHLRGISE